MSKLTAWFNNLSIRAKIQSIIMTISTIVLLIAFSMFLFYDYFSFRNQLRQDAVQLARLIGENNIASIYFNQQKSAQKNLLDILSVDEKVLYGCIFFNRDSIFAYYERKWLDFQPPAGRDKINYILENQSSFQRNYTPIFREEETIFNLKEKYLDVFVPILHENEQISTVYLRIDLQVLYDRYARYLIAFLSIILLTLLIAYVISIPLQRPISKPILALSQATHEISTRKDYSLRLSKKSNDEIGMLVSGFNEMLAEIERQNKDLIQAKEQAERSAKIKEQFLANMSHEIRTPMNGMKPFIELMLETELNQQQRKYMEIIKSSSDNLLVIINDILDITKIESGHLVFEEDVIELNTLIEKVIENQRVLFEQKKIQVYKKIAPDVPPTFLGDPVRLSQILMNLFSNAVKFTEQGSITIGANLLESTKDSVLLRFYVKDTGIGIPEDKLDYIFNIFTQAHSSTTRKYGGTGLGLSICKQLVEMQKGKIWVESKLNEGSTFYFQIYFKNHKQREKLKRPKLPLSLDISDINLKNELKEYFSKNISLPILLAEDNETNQEVVKEFFKKINENISVVVAQNGKIVLEMLEKNDFSLILMDLHMPELDGYDTASAIRNHPTARYKNIPIIAMTASPSKEKAEQCLSIGMDDYISKPINMNEFADKLLRVLKLKKV